MQDNVSEVHAKGVKMGRYFRLITYNNLKGQNFRKLQIFQFGSWCRKMAGLIFAKKRQILLTLPPKKNSQLLMVS